MVLHPGQRITLFMLWFLAFTEAITMKSDVTGFKTALIRVTSSITSLPADAVLFFSVRILGKNLFFFIPSTISKALFVCFPSDTFYSSDTGLKYTRIKERKAQIGCAVPIFQKVFYFGAHLSCNFLKATLTSFFRQLSSPSRWLLVLW